MNESKNKNLELQGWEAPLAVAAIFGGFWYKYGFAIQVWVHQNMVGIVLTGAALFMLLGYILVWRFRKKNEENIARMRRLAQAKPPTKSPDSYYQRRRDREFDHE